MANYRVCLPTEEGIFLWSIHVNVWKEPLVHVEAMGKVWSHRVLLLRSMRFLVGTEEQNAAFLTLLRKTPIGRTDTTGLVNPVNVFRRSLCIRKEERFGFHLH